MLFLNNMSVTQINKDSFQAEVLDQKGIVFVDFYADWCGPCKMTGPILEELAKEKKEMKFVKVNVDENPELTSQYQIFSIPTFVVFKEGKMVSQFVGGHSKEGFHREINKTMS